jgi:hypothetical protein
MDPLLTGSSDIQSTRGSTMNSLIYSSVVGARFQHEVPPVFTLINEYEREDDVLVMYISSVASKIPWRTTLVDHIFVRVEWWALLGI